MNIPPDITDLIKRLNQELEETEREVSEGINLVRLPLSRFPENTLLVQFFAYLNNIIFLVGNYRQRIRATLDLLLEVEVEQEKAREAIEELATMLGVVLETKIQVENIVNRLRNLS
ncbi:restriction endonuclease subunit S [Merismopedia glauca]|uniref:Restriction endonuclease subunit S n=1 Tax=Merismopedia glauca CCAP 1448/3 TaxID=1296344 RepID=A0A2T1C011_9CYAN|nr:restriction endonuclease subunit S [Merismopedia glauca]PSB01609.1 restriction endonuclease subunit S [Merismopedia glauca CCAP 1448/3]